MARLDSPSNWRRKLSVLFKLLFETLSRAAGFPDAQPKMPARPQQHRHQRQQGEADEQFDQRRSGALTAAARPVAPVPSGLLSPGIPTSRDWLTFSRSGLHPPA